jgi:hypothetical protein
MENNIRIFIFGDSFASNLFQEGYEKLPDHHINPTQIGQYLLDLKEENIDDALWFSDWLTKFGYQVYNYGQGGSDNQTILEQFTKLDKEFRPGDRIILWLSSFSRFQWINDMSERWSINANSVLHGIDYKDNDLLLKQCWLRENSFRNGYMSRATLPFYEYFIDLHSRYNPIVVSFCNQTNQKMKNYKHFVSFDTTGSVSLLKFGNFFKTNIITETNGQIVDGHFDRKTNLSYAIIFDEIIKSGLEKNYSKNRELLEKIKLRIETDTTVFRKPKKWEKKQDESKKIFTNVI